MFIWEVIKAMFNSSCRSSCPTLALIVSAIIGIVTAFLQISGIITVGTAFLWVCLGVAVVYLGGLTVASLLLRRNEQNTCTASSLKTLLAGLLGAILFSVVLLAVGIIATSILNAVLVGLLLFFSSLTVTSAACFVKCAY